LNPRLAIDTNILAYSEGVGDSERQAQAEELLARLVPERTVVPVQVLGELFNVLVRKGRRRPVDAGAAITELRQAFAVVETSDRILLGALQLAVDHQFSVWDAIILAAAAEAGCGILLSEDMQDGFTWSGVTVVNPFKTPWPPLLESALATG
jgi:predicted nucleic acid-binding protein